MTMTTVVAIMREADAQTNAAGNSLRSALGSTPWQLVCAAELAAVVASFSAEQLAPSRDNLISWLKMLSQLGLSRSIVPMRFGQAAENPAEIERFLTCRQEHFRSVLALVGHRVELVVRVVSTAANAVATGENAPAISSAAKVTTASAGRRFLLDRKRDLFNAAGGEDAQTAEQIVRLAIGNRVVAIAHEPPTGTIRRGGVCVLVDRTFSVEGIGLIRAAAATARVSVHVTGPLPPLGFSSGDRTGGAGTALATGHETFPLEPSLTRPGRIACER